MCGQAVRHLHQSQRLSEGKTTMETRRLGSSDLDITPIGFGAELSPSEVAAVAAYVWALGHQSEG
jgi:hypothetical protein